MLASAAAQRYQAVQVKTASPGEILVMLYDGVFRFLGEARAAIERDDRPKAGERIDRSHAIITELAAGLNRSVAPELCDQLGGIYSFCMGRLVEANLTRDPAKIDEVLRVLAPLRDGFREAVRIEAAKGGQK
jgi:flagellar protein FliS